MQLRALKKSTRVKQSTPPSHFSSSMAASALALKLDLHWVQINNTTAKLYEAHIFFNTALFAAKTSLLSIVMLCQMTNVRRSYNYRRLVYSIAKMGCATNKHLQWLLNKAEIQHYCMSQALCDITNSLPFSRSSCTHFQSNGFETLQ